MAKGNKLQNLPSPSNTENNTNSNIAKPNEEQRMPQKRKRPHSWPKNVRPSTPKPVEGKQRRPALNESEDSGKEIEVYYKPAERDSNCIIIGCT